MPGVLPVDSNGLSRGTPTKKSRLSLKFFQKRETKRALDFAEVPENEQKTSEYVCSEIDQVVPAARPLSPVRIEKKDNMLPFVGLNNLGNTCYLNSVLQVLYFCPGFKMGMKQLFNIISKKKDDTDKGTTKENSHASYELLHSLHSLIVSLEQLQASCLLNPDKYTDELAVQPRRLLNTLRELNPMYEGYLQHDAQEVLQCILGHIQGTCQLLMEELKHKSPQEPMCNLEKETKQNKSSSAIVEEGGHELDGQAEKDWADRTKGKAKRKSDVESGNEKKKSKVSQEKVGGEEVPRRTRSRRRALEEKVENHFEPYVNEMKMQHESENTKPTHKKSKLRLNWLKSSSNQPSILSKFCSLGKLTTSLGLKEPVREMDSSDFSDNSFKYEKGSQIRGEHCDASFPGEGTAEKEVEKQDKRG